MMMFVCNVLNQFFLLDINLPDRRENGGETKKAQISVCGVKMGRNNPYKGGIATIRVFDKLNKVLSIQANYERNRGLRDYVVPDTRHGRLSITIELKNA